MVALVGVKSIVLVQTGYMIRGYTLHHKIINSDIGLDLQD